MSLVAEPVPVDGRAVPAVDPVTAAITAPIADPIVDPLVARLSQEYGADPAEVRAWAVAAVASFADARVQAFVPILVEKQLRERYRLRRKAG